MKSISTLRRKAKAIYLRIEKGFVHCLAYDGIVFRNMYGEREVGYSLIDLTTGYYVWPSYDNEFPSFGMLSKTSLIVILEKQCLLSVSQWI